MKKIVFLLAILCILPNLIQAQKTYVPDNIFEDYLIGEGWDDVMDDSVLTANISGEPLIDVNYLGINDLTGIEDFTSLQILKCDNNNLSAINVSGAPALRQLFCGNNNLTSLVVTYNTALTLLACNGNSITILNVNQNTALISLSCSNNGLSTLILDGATNLQILSCERNQIKVLDLSQNIALKILNCQYNQLIKLDVHNGHNDLITSFNSMDNASLACIEVDNAVAANNGDAPYTWWSKDATASYSDDCILPTTWIPDDNFELALIARGYDNELNDYATTYIISDISSLDVSGEGISDLTGIEAFVSLGQLNCSDNDLTTLDISLNVGLTYLNCSNNDLTSLDVRNGQNALLTSFHASDNPSLSCIQVDDEIKAQNGDPPYNLWEKDPAAVYSANCSLAGIKIYVPDDNFEQSLIDKGLDMAPLDDSVSASIISFVTVLDVNSEYIQDLAGIEGFTNLVTLHCYNNLITNLDLSQNLALENLSCYTNQLTSLDVSNNVALKGLNCTNNLLERLDLSANPELAGLNCQNNQIDSLNVKNNYLLAYLSCRKNQLSHLDLSNNNALENLDCFDNNLSSLDVHNKASLNYLDCGQNQIKDLNVSGANLGNFYCAYNQLTTLDLSTNSSLLRLECFNNEITELDLSDKGYLWLLICNNNKIASLDLTDNTALIDFVCHHNELTGLNLETNILLGSVNCSYNEITSTIDLSSNPDLLSVNVSHNPVEIVILPVSEKKSKADNKLEYLDISYTLITSIDILNNTSLSSLNLQGIPLDSLDVSGNVNLISLNTTGTDLVCIQVNQDQFNNIPAGWVKDVITVYSTDCKATTPIEDQSLTESICLYPNPAGEIIYIESDFRIDKVEILSVSGMKLMEIQNDCNIIPVDYLLPGLYILRIESKAGYAIKKFSKK